MADWSLPSLSSLYTAWKQLISDRLDDCAKMFDGVTATNLPAGTKKWNVSSSKWEKYDGTNWSDMASVYGISISGNAASSTTATLANDSSKLGGQTPSYYQTALGYAPVNKAGDTMTGDLYLYRSAYPTTGVVFLGNTGQRYLYYNGSSYEMPNSELYVYGGMVLRANNAKTINGTSLWGAGNISLQSPLVSGSNIKTVGGISLLGSGDVPISSGLGEGQTWKIVTRTRGVTYYNTTGKPIAVVGFSTSDNLELTLTIGVVRVDACYQTSGTVFGIVPSNQSYVLIGHADCRELR